MKMNMSAEKRFVENIFYVLNRIKTELLLYPEKKRIVDYVFDIRGVRDSGITYTEEKSVIQKLIKDKIIAESTEETPTDVRIGTEFTPNYRCYLIYHFKISKKFDNCYDKYQRIQLVNQTYCWFDNNTFYFTLKDSSIKSISFDTQRGTRQMLILFQVMIEHWKRHENLPIKATEIVEAMKSLGITINPYQLNDIFSNLRNKKIKPSGLKNNIQINYDRQYNGWCMSINRK